MRKLNKRFWREQQDVTLYKTAFANGCPFRMEVSVSSMDEATGLRIRLPEILYRGKVTTSALRYLHRKLRKLWAGYNNWQKQNTVFMYREFVPSGPIATGTVTWDGRVTLQNYRGGYHSYRTDGFGRVQRFSLLDEYVIMGDRKMSIMVPKAVCPLEITTEAHKRQFRKRITMMMQNRFYGE